MRLAIRPLLLHRAQSATRVVFQQAVARADQRSIPMDLHAAAQEELPEVPGPFGEHEKVTNNHIKDGERLVELEVWAQNGNREVAI